MGYNASVKPRRKQRWQFGPPGDDEPVGKILPPNEWILCGHCHGEGCHDCHGQGAYWTDAKGNVIDGLPPHLKALVPT